MQFLYFLSSTTPPRYKIGIGNHLHKRVRQVDRTTKGHQRVLIAFDMPFGARRTETMLHRRYNRYHAPLKHGSGKTEWFRRGLWVIEGILIAFFICFCQWAIIWLQIYLILLIFLT
jgi:Meiotically up-regulated gene 113